MTAHDQGGTTLLDTSVATAPLSSDEPLIPTKLVADVLTDVQRTRIETEEGVNEVATEIVAMLRRPSNHGTDLAKAVAEVGGTMMRRSAVRESLRALLKTEREEASAI
jgi:hypothetical protein